MDPPLGSVMYTIGVVVSRIGGSIFGIPPGRRASALAQSGYAKIFRKERDLTFLRRLRALNRPQNDVGNYLSLCGWLSKLWASFGSSKY